MFLFDCAFAQQGKLEVAQIIEIASVSPDISLLKAVLVTGEITTVISQSGSNLEPEGMLTIKGENLGRDNKGNIHCGPCPNCICDRIKYNGPDLVVIIAH